MVEAATTPPPSRGRSPWWARVGIALGVLILAFVLLVLFFPWDVLRGPLNRYVSEKTGRHFEITRRLDVKPGFTTRVIADGIEFANPDWARDRYLVKAEGAEIDVRLFPLLRRQIVLPRVMLSKPELGLQMEGDGRRSWALGGDTSDSSNVPVIGSLIVDNGVVRFLAPAEQVDLTTDVAIEGAQDQEMPLSYKARGTYRGEPFLAQGRTGSVLQLNGPLESPFPVEVDARAGRTSLKASGRIASLATIDGTDAAFSIRGHNLVDLYKLIGVVLPETPPYAISGRLGKQGAVWTAAGLEGRLGASDIAGDLQFDQSQPVAKLSGSLQTKSLDFDDLAPLVGLAPSNTAGEPTVAVTASGKTQTVPLNADKKSQPAAGKVLPNAQIDLARLKAMNADVRYSAARIKNVKGLPLEKGSVHVKLQDGSLQLDPLQLGVANGRLAGHLRINGNSNPATVETKLAAQQLQLSKLFPTVKLTEDAFGRLNGNIDLKTRGNSTADMLGNSDGSIALLMGRGEISNILLEFMGLDGGEVIKFFLAGDRKVNLRCAAAGFNVKKGVMTSHTIVLDTDDTVIGGDGVISLADETMDVTLRPKPKDVSILSLRSPLKIGGTFDKPSAFPDKGALAGRAGLAVALGLINPILALAATIETGPGEDTDCKAVLAQAASVGKR